MRLVIQDKDHFITTPCGNVGDMPLLPDLIGKHYKQVLAEYPNAELHEHDDQYLLILPNVELPEEWIPKIVDLLILIPQGYPAAALDMFFVSPNIKLSSGQQPDRGNHFESFLGKKWQRFSWHYQSRKWNPSRDTLSSHINFCLSRFALKK